MNKSAIVASIIPQYSFFFKEKFTFLKKCAFITFFTGASVDRNYNVGLLHTRSVALFSVWTFCYRAEGSVNGLGVCQSACWRPIENYKPSAIVADGTCSFLICRFRWVNDIDVSFYSPFLVCEDLEIFQLCPTSKPPPYPFLTEQNASTGLDQKEHRPKGCTPLIEVRVLGAPSGHPTPRKVTYQRMFTLIVTLWRTFTYIYTFIYCGSTLWGIILVVHLYETALFTQKFLREITYTINHYCASF